MTFKELIETLNNKYEQYTMFIVEYRGVAIYRKTNVNGIIKFLYMTFIVEELHYYVTDVHNKVFITME